MGSVRYGKKSSHCIDGNVKLIRFMNSTDESNGFRGTAASDCRDEKPNMIKSSALKEEMVGFMQPSDLNDNDCRDETVGLLTQPSDLYAAKVDAIKGSHLNKESNGNDTVFLDENVELTKCSKTDEEKPSSLKSPKFSKEDDILRKLPGQRKEKDGSIKMAENQMPLSHIRSRSEGDLESVDSGVNGLVSAANGSSGGLNFTAKDSYDCYQDDRQRKKAVVSFVVEEEHEMGNLTDKETNRIAWTSLLSVIYCIILVVIGIVFTVNEAIRKRWDTNPIMAGFFAYLYAFSAVTLVVTHIYMKFQNKKSKHIHHHSHHYHHGSGRHHHGGTRDLHPVKVANNYAEKNELSKDAIILRLRNYDVTSVATIKSSPNLSRRKSADREDIPQVSSFADLIAASESNNYMDNMDLCNTNKRSAIGDVLDASVESASSSGSSDSDKSDEDDFDEQVLLLHKTASQSHEGTNFYLRLGIVLFGIGNMVFVCLEIRAFIEHSRHCEMNQYLFPRYIYLVFLIIQTFLLFKNTSVHFKKYKGIARFAWMHVLATNLIVWYRTLVKEIIETYEHHAHESEKHAQDGMVKRAIPYVPLTFADADDENHNSTLCEEGIGIPFLTEAAPYLFAFVLEYSLVAVSVQAGIYRSLNIYIKTDLLKSLRHAIKHSKTRQAQEEHAHHEQFFARSHTGLYLGVLVLAGCVISVIFFFVCGGDVDCDYIYFSTSGSVNMLQIIACAMGFYHFRHLRFTFTRDNTIDQAFLLFSWAGLFLMIISVILANASCLYSTHSDDVTCRETDKILYAIASRVIANIATLVQTCFIIDGLQRCTDNKDIQHRKPGRGAITFLVITNITMWLYESITTKLIHDEMFEYYGHLWPIISNIGIPLGLFYRFHCSVCFADIWHIAYVQEEEEHYKVF